MQKSILSFLLLMTISQFSNAQNKFNDYTKDWEKVYKLELESLPKSALIEVEKIYVKSKKDNNTPQLVKSLIYKSKFALTLEEDAQLKIIKGIKAEIALSNFPAKNILESVLADIYWQYFKQNRWKFYNRTNTDEKVDDIDFRTWDLQTIFEETHAHFQNSLSHSLELQHVDLSAYNDILSLQVNSKEYRPSLYDFIAHRAIDFYRNDEQSLTRPSYKFEIKDTNLLGTNKQFISADISSKDNLSQQLHALKLYRNLTLFHSKDSNPTALIDLALDRLDFIKSKAVFEDKDSLHLQSLHLLKEVHKNHEISTEIDFRIAKAYHEQANTYQPKTNEDYRFKNTEALKVCELAIANYPESKGAKKCKNLKALILQKNLAITSEKYIPISTPSRLLIDYKNTEILFFSAYKITKEEQKEFNKIHNDSVRVSFIKKLDATKKWNASLRNENDYQQHKTEVLLPQLSQGNYLIVATTESDELKDEETLAYTFMQVTNLVLIENNSNGEYIYQVVDRNNGKPIENANVHLKNYNTGKYNKPINRHFTTDKNGQFSFKSSSRYRNVVSTVTYKDDTAIFGNFYLNKYHKNESNRDQSITIKPFIFTDRSIYRPGQTVYFKTIVLKKQGEKSEVLSDEYFEVILTNVNGETVKKLTLKLNEFGSVSGEFILPNNGLTGEYSIGVDESSEHGNKFYNNADYDIDDIEYHFSVEEYKRPKFETEFKPVTETYKLNDSITVNGSATAFSGSNTTDAKVAYRVVRTANYPRWFSWYRPSYYQSEEMEITNGESVTDADGNYEITFKAIPDLKVSKDSQPTFNYKVFADVTDINGETRSTETNVKVGYHALTANVSIDAKIDKTSKDNKLTITTNNLNSEFVPTKGTIKIYKLVAPENPLRKRPWSAPDYQDFTETEFKNLFPHDPFTDAESNENQWKKGKLVFDKTFDTDKSKELNLGTIKKWISGKYIVVLDCKDKFGQEVKDEQRFTVFSNKDTKIADSKLFFINTDKTSYKENEQVELLFGSASKDITVTIQVEKNHQIVSTHFVHLNNETKTLKIDVNKEDIGGFAIKYYYVNYNSFDSGSLNISVPYDEDNLSIETLTFRDKLKPGSEQTWSFKIKGDKNDKIAAELLASMYDASLDEFKTHDWSFNPIQRRNYSSYGNSSANHSFGTNRFNIRNQQHNRFNIPQQGYDNLNWFGFSLNRNQFRIRGASSMRMNNPIQVDESEAFVEDVIITESMKSSPEYAIMIKKGKMIPDDKIVGGKSQINIAEVPNLKGIKIRKNFNETAFFFPHLRTDKDGTVSFDFTVPEALTRWKLQLLAHTKDMKSATKTLSTVTQKELMVLPNPPRFLREGDQIIFSSKISNLTDKNLNGIAQLQLTDAITGTEIDGLLENIAKNQSFEVDAKGNTNVSWSLKIPHNKVQAIQYKIVAKAGDFSDGEQNALPVLSNRMLVTETLPMWIRSNQSKTFTLDKLKDNTSTTLSNHKLTLEVTSNPAWYAVQALPYLMEYPYDCAEQTFSRYYANALASHIANSNPRIQEVFNQWKSSDALLSNLEKNQELKSLIIQETPWLRDAQSETEQKKRIALLFDLNKMKNESESAINKLKQMQFGNGGFPWFKGAEYPNRYITQHIASGFGHLNKLGVSSSAVEKSTEILTKAVQFLDEEILDDYQKLLERASIIRQKERTKSKGIKAEKDYLAKNHLGHLQLQYLYMRSFYPQLKINDKLQTAIDYYRNQSATYWKEYNLYSKAMIALVQHRNSNKTVSAKILKSLKENSITNDELGMYWISTAGFLWHQAPVETQALMIELFSEAGSVILSEEKNLETIDNLKIWLLKNKQTNRWKTTKATTEAVYALLLQGSDWLEVTDFMDVKIGDKEIDPLELEESKVEAGTGYFKTSFYRDEIKPEMATVTLTKDTDGIAWGALYWQYFEDLDKITSAETPLKLSKKLFLKKNTDKGEEISEITKETNLKLGDLVRVRIELRVDRVMEFVHMKDMRASGFEPINVLSKYKYQDGLGYYESTKDASTNFFFDRLPKGVYVFEYDLRVNNAGDFSNGITTIQSMYAPEFSSHSEGVRVKID
ncbi:MAG: alpha-2-macroglobulin [Lutibacter sp.]|nr:MAG: alpha-2-macroglobulin [Lutibacter sp.]